MWTLSRNAEGTILKYSWKSNVRKYRSQIQNIVHHGRVVNAFLEICIISDGYTAGIYQSRTSRNGELFLLGFQSNDIEFVLYNLEWKLYILVCCFCHKLIYRSLLIMYNLVIGFHEQSVSILHASNA